MNTSTHALSNSQTTQVVLGTGSGGQSKAFPPTNDDVLRAKITAVLASTANGCLSELGYFPGIVPTLAAVEREAALLKADNVKMFEDNRTLAHLVSVQTARINLDAERIAKYDELKRRLNEVINERNQLRQMVTTSPASDPTMLSNMTTELEKTKTELGVAMAQIKQMTAQLDQQHFLINAAGSSNTMLGHGPTEPPAMSMQNTSLSSIPPTPIPSISRFASPPTTPAMSASGDLHGEPTSPMYSLVPMPPPPNLVEDPSTSTTRSQILHSIMKRGSFSSVAPREPLLSADNATKRTEIAPLASTSAQGMIEGALLPAMSTSHAIVRLGSVDSPMDGTDGVHMQGEPLSLGLSAGMGDGEEEEEVEDEEEDEAHADISIDDDGLRSIDSCLLVLFEVVENEPHKRICALCHMRYRKGAAEVDAVPYDHPERSALLEHALTEHRMAWERLRQEVDI